LTDRIVTADLSDGTILKVEAVDLGGSELVGDVDLVAPFSSVAESIESVSRRLLDAVKQAEPDKSTIELKFGIAAEAGKLFAFLAKGSADASVKVTLEWSRNSTSHS
jgi:hypothetical protein